jgi:hypothetical protein
LKIKIEGARALPERARNQESGKYYLRQESRLETNELMRKTAHGEGSPKRCNQLAQESFKSDLSKWTFQTQVKIKCSLVTTDGPVATGNQFMFVAAIDAGCTHESLNYNFNFTWICISIP